MSRSTETIGEDYQCDDGSGHVGALLQNARQARGDDLEAISAALRIRPAQLRALEEGWWDELPAEAYVIGFLKSYARYLGLNECDIVSRYRAENGATRVQSPLLFPEPIDESRIPKAPVAILSAFLALMGYSIWYFTAGSSMVAIDSTSMVPPHLASLAEEPVAEPVMTAAARPRDARQKDARQKDAADVPMPTEVTVAVSRRIAMVSAPAHEPRKMVAQATAPSDDRWSSVSTGFSRIAESAPSLIRSAHASNGSADVPSRVILRAKADTWIQVEDGDKNTLQAGLLKAGEQYRAPDLDGVTLTTSNIAALEILVDGTPVQSLGTEGTIRKGLPLDAEELSKKLRTDT